MRRKLLVLLILILLPLSGLLAEDIFFKGGNSRVVLKEGREQVNLTNGATVEVGSLKIESDEMILSGENWSDIECIGNVRILDEERNLDIFTSRLYYDRENEILLISSYYEIDDRGNELTASANQLKYDMKAELLEMKGRVRLNKVDGEDVVKVKAESVSYDRNTENLLIKGDAEVTYKGDEYKAELVKLDLEKETISLDGKIRGTING